MRRIRRPSCEIGITINGTVTEDYDYTTTLDGLANAANGLKLELDAQPDYSADSTGAVITLEHITGQAIAFYLLGRYTTQISPSVLLSIIIALFVGIILGHLFWGRKHIEGQQEDIIYLGEGGG